MARVRPSGIKAHLTHAVQRAELLQHHLGADVCGDLVHHARLAELHWQQYRDEQVRITRAARDVGIDIDSLGR